MLALGVGLHITQDSLANTVSLLWPLRRREYGLGLDRLGDVTDHGEYVRRYPASPAGKLEAALMLAALAAGGMRLSGHRRAKAKPKLGGRRWAGHRRGAGAASRRDQTLHALRRG
jgi:hypothetical protein